MSRYARQTILPEVGEDGQARLAAATLAVVLFRFFDLIVPVVTGAVAARRSVADADESSRELLPASIIWLASWIIGSLVSSDVMSNPVEG